MWVSVVGDGGLGIEFGCVRQDLVGRVRRFGCMSGVDRLYIRYLSWHRWGGVVF